LKTFFRISGTVRRWKIRLCALRVSFQTSGTISASYVVKSASRPPCARRTQSPFRCVSLSSGSWRCAVSLCPRSASNGTFVLFSAIISSR